MEENKLDKIWDKIAEDLTLSYTEHNRASLIKAIDELPKYNAPEGIWNNIENQIDKKTRVINLYQVSLVAASIALLLSLAIWLNKWVFSEGKVQYNKVSYSSINLYEIADTSSIVFSKIINITCGVKPSYCASAEFKNFEKEYKELTQMQEKILSKALQYDNESDLEAMLLKIENQKKMIEQHLIEQINS